MKRSLPMVFALASATAFAAVLTFSHVNATVTSDSLRIAFSVSGLPGNSTGVDIRATADASAVYGCFNRGGNNPRAAAKRTTVHSQVNGGTSLNIGPGGFAVGSITLQAPGAGGFDCPRGQTAQLSQVTFTNARLTGPGNVSSPVPGSFTKVV